MGKPRSIIWQYFYPVVEGLVHFAFCLVRKDHEAQPNKLSGCSISKEGQCSVLGVKCSSNFGGQTQLLAKLLAGVIIDHLVGESIDARSVIGIEKDKLHL
jgi:hypothetical protein